MEELVMLAHGSGGQLGHELVEKVIAPVFRNPILEKMDDSAVFDLPGRLAFTTDSYVVSPLFFPGGDIGRLAICGTVNDLAMAGASPRYLSLALIIEEGFPLDDLRRVLASARAAADEAGVVVVTGDTKVVSRGQADGLFINTAGVGSIPDGVNVSGRYARPGDRVLVSGTLGDHGITIMLKRSGMQFDSHLESDCAPLNLLVRDMLSSCPGIHVLRDPTRGGLASTLNEIALQSSAGIELYEEALPVKVAVRAACELLGFDPLYVANEGKLVAILPPGEAETVLAAMKENRYGRDAAIIGEVSAEHPGRVLMRTRLGTRRILDMLSGELLPRIC
jgi:hydrogenase expression/formation protein HypE